MDDDVPMSAKEGSDEPGALGVGQRRREKRDVHGWVILDKPVGMTSTHAVSVIKHLFAARRAGLPVAGMRHRAMVGARRRPHLSVSTVAGRGIAGAVAHSIAGNLCPEQLGRPAGLDVPLWRPPKRMSLVIRKIRVTAPARSGG